MTQRRNKLIELAAQGRPAFGGAVHAGDISRARVLGDSTFDFVMVDLEHEGFDMPRLGDTLQWLVSRRRMARTGDLYPSPTPIVRLPHTLGERTTWIASQALDYGALGIIMPYTEHAEDVEHMVRAVRYPRPGSDGRIVGERRVWPKLAARYWGCADYDEYLDMADLWPLVDHGEIALIAMVATPTALRNIEEIASVPGLTGVLFGAKHAWSALGRRGPIDLDHPDLVDFRSSVLSACQKAGIVAGTSLSGKPPTGGAGVVDLPFLTRRIDDGFGFFLTQGGGRPDVGR
ncbi:aldolase/citrate lyase family protein [Dactylosporangium sp. AC04546]|uniref:aldolase/citrate lyase family protein n=1 Tax=Dactylosporangium sp. AC04546 TaxID=2862460 RepID=UPI001EDE6BB3|nr:aldolase/citrate lyase family protein [Dactylosporangium sp. AC04546]WVK79532.1 aldolase/citrate lyase family protein [Dactylosporangium sp. AC04546]